MADPISIIATPIVGQVVAGGKAFLSRLTDSLELLTLPGNIVAFSVSNEEGDSHLALTIPLYIWNRSTLEDGVIRNLQLDMVGLSEEHSPYDGIIEMAAAFLVPSLDYVEKEAWLAAQLLRNSADALDEELESHRRQHRRILESVYLPAQRMTQFHAEFRCLMGEGCPMQLVGEFRTRIKCDAVFPNALLEKGLQLAEFDVAARFPLSRNTVYLRPRIDIPFCDWRNLTSLAQLLRDAEASE